MGFQKDLFGLEELSPEEIRYLLRAADTMKYVLRQKKQKAPHLQGKSVILLFYEPSARGKLSFELAAQHLCANVVDMTGSSKADSVSSLQDMGQLIDQMGADFIILRHGMAGAPKLLAKYVEASVINAGDGYHENPGQALLDLLTIQERKGSFAGLKVAVIGDILHSRLAKSDIWGLTKLGAEVRVSGPPTLVLPEVERLGVQYFYDASEAVRQADVILTTRLEPESLDGLYLPSFDEYKQFFRIDEKRIRLAKPDVIIMHPGPVRKGIEISQGVVNSSSCIINDQMANSVAVRMAMLYVLSSVGGGLL